MTNDEATPPPDESDAEYAKAFAALGKCPTCGTTKSDEHEPGCIWLHEYPWPKPAARPDEDMPDCEAMPSERRDVVTNRAALLNGNRAILTKTESADG